MPTCHNEVEYGATNPLTGKRLKKTCGRVLLAHDHGLVERTLAVQGTTVHVQVPEGGPWRYCVGCDTNEGGCDACVREMRRIQP